MLPYMGQKCKNHSVVDIMADCQFDVKKQFIRVLPFFCAKEIGSKQKNNFYHVHRWICKCLYECIFCFSQMYISIIDAKIGNRMHVWF